MVSIYLYCMDKLTLLVYKKYRIYVNVCWIKSIGILKIPFEAVDNDDCVVWIFLDFEWISI